MHKTLSKTDWEKACVVRSLRDKQGKMSVENKPRETY